MNFLKKPYQIKLCRFDLETPKMKEAMINLGLVKEDVNTTKLLSDFYHPDETIANIRFKHYRNHMMETVNQLLGERRKILLRNIAQHAISSRVQGQLPRELRQQQHQQSIDEVAKLVQLKLQAGLVRLEQTEKKKLDIVQKSFDKFEQKIVIDKIREFKDKRAKQHVNEHADEQAYLNGKRQQKSDGRKEFNLKNLETHREKFVLGIQEKELAVEKRLQMSKSTSKFENDNKMVPNSSRTIQQDDSAISLSLNKIESQLTKTARRRDSILRRVVSEKRIKNQHAFGFIDKRQSILKEAETDLLRSVSEKQKKFKKHVAKLKNETLIHDWQRNKDHQKKLVTIQSNKEQVDKRFKETIEKTSNRIFMNDLKVQEKKQEVSGDMAINKELLELKKLDLNQILVQNKRIRDTKISKMLQEYAIRRQVKEKKQSEEEIARQKLNQEVIKKQQERVERQQQIQRYFNSPSKVPTAEIKMTATHLGLKLPQNPKYLKVNEKLHIMAKIEQEGDLSHGEFRRYVAPYMKQPNLQELAELEQFEKSKTAR